MTFTVAAASKLLEEASSSMLPSPISVDDLGVANAVDDAARALEYDKAAVSSTSTNNSSDQEVYAASYDESLLPPHDNTTNHPNAAVDAAMYLDLEDLHEITDLLAPVSDDDTGSDDQDQNSYTSNNHNHHHHEGYQIALAAASMDHHLAEALEGFVEDHDMLENDPLLINMGAAVTTTTTISTTTPTTTAPSSPISHQRVVTPRTDDLQWLPPPHPTKYEQALAVAPPLKKTKKKTGSSKLQRAPNPLLSSSGGARSRTSVSSKTRHVQPKSSSTTKRKKKKKTSTSKPKPQRRQPTPAKRPHVVPLKPTSWPTFAFPTSTRPPLCTHWVKDSTSLQADVVTTDTALCVVPGGTFVVPPANKKKNTTTTKHKKKQPVSKKTTTIKKKKKVVKKVVKVKKPSTTKSSSQKAANDTTTTTTAPSPSSTIPVVHCANPLAVYAAKQAQEAAAAKLAAEKAQRAAKAAAAAKKKHTEQQQAAAAKTSSSATTTTSSTTTPTKPMTAEEKAKACRDRNREHAKNTRLRKKAYVEELKLNLNQLVDERDAALVQQRQVAVRQTETRSVRFQVMQDFLQLRGNNEPHHERWAAILDAPQEFRLTMPGSTTFEPHVLAGVTDIMADSVQFADLLQTLGADDTVSFHYDCHLDTFLLDGTTGVLQWTGTSCGATTQELTLKGTFRASFCPDTNKLRSGSLMFDTGAIRARQQQQQQQQLGDH